MHKQTEQQYRDVRMGFGTGSIYDYGCYMVSLLNGLNQKGYSFTPISFNDMLKNAGAWTGPTKNYIDVINLHKYFPNVFEHFQQIDPWNDVPPARDFIAHNLVVVGRVDARGIGGSGTHFVLIDGVDNGVVRIHDPWTGNTELVTKRYGKLGNILGVRIFRVKPYNQPSPQPPTNQPPASAPTISKATAISEVYEGLVGQKANSDEVARYINRRLDEVVREVTQNDPRYYNFKVKATVEETVKKRDEQWTQHLKTELDKQKTASDQAKQESDRIWQSKLDTAKELGVAGIGGLELISRGIAKILTGKL